MKRVRQNVGLSDGRIGSNPGVAQKFMGFVAEAVSLCSQFRRDRRSGVIWKR
jgi:hypothetical protein